MSKLNGKKLSFARIVAPAFVPNFGELKGDLQTSTPGTKVLSMTVDEPFIMVDVKDKLSQSLTIAVPLTSFSHVVAEKE